MPDPDTLERYDQVLPGAADRMLRSVESQTVDASKRDDRIADAQIVIAARGQGWAVFLAVTCIVAAIVFFAQGNLIAGGALLSPPVLLFIASLIPRHRE